MTNEEAINWIINISADIGKSEHRDLWHYEQALYEIRDMLEDVTDTNVGDLISREAVYMANEHLKPCSPKDVEDMISCIPSAQRWIPCSERLPEEGERVLATHLGGVNPNNQVIEHIYQRGKFTCGWDMDMNVDSPTFGQRYMGEVIAWMPLPEPWKGENNG